ncbi:MAG: type I secretion system permease/ATPase [Rhodocyclaceae bacterium]|nr:type I secretion system permease/ATPase [Rhodocyclaceae bacterium]
MKQLFDTRHELGKVLLSFRPAFIQALGFSLVINLLLLVPSIYMLQVYDRVLTSRNGTTLLMLTLLMLALYVLYGVLDAVRTRILLNIGTGFENSLKERVFTAAFQRHLQRQGGNPAQAVQDVASVRTFISGAGALAFFDAPWFPIYILVISLIHPWLGVFSIVAALILLALTWLNELLTHKPITEAGAESIAALVYANNNLRSAETISAMGMINSIRQRWSERYNRAAGLSRLAGERGAVVGAISKTTRIAFQSLILGLGAWLAMDDLITPGGMIAASILMGRALAPIENLIVAWKKWIAAEAAHQRLQELLRNIPALDKALSLPPPTGNISVENVAAIPPGTKIPVLKGLAFRINAGDVVGVIGPSGAGKSCLARLLVGIWPAASGYVRLDGADVYTWDKGDLGPHIGYLAQDIALFDGTVAENICRFGPPDDEKIVAAARIAGVHDLVLHLPKGYETPVGADGAALSGGQRQRIGLARALYGDPRLVVLDEPNSNLDDAGEAAVIQAILAMKKRGATVVFIAHGTHLLGAANKLLALREGALVVYGPSDQVISHLQAQNQPKVISA